MGQQGGEKSEGGGRWICVPKQLDSVQNTIVAGAGEAELEQFQHEERRMEVGLGKVSLHEEEEMRQDGLLRGDGETVDCATPRIEIVRHIRALELREGENAILVDACGTRTAHTTRLLVEDGSKVEEEGVKHGGEGWIPRSILRTDAHSGIQIGWRGVSIRLNPLLLRVVEIANGSTDHCIAY